MESRTLKQLFHDKDVDKNMFFKLGVTGFFFLNSYLLSLTYTIDRYALFLISSYLIFRFVIRPVTIRYQMLRMFHQLRSAQDYFYANTKQNFYAALEDQGYAGLPEHATGSLSGTDWVTPSSFLYSLPLVDSDSFEHRYRYQTIYQQLYYRHQMVHRLQELHLKFFGMHRNQMPISSYNLEKVQHLLLEYRIFNPSLFLDPRYEGEKFCEQDKANFLRLLNYFKAVKHELHIHS